MRQVAIIALGDFHDVLDEGSTQSRSNAACALRRFGGEAKPAVPALLRMLKDPDPNLRSVSEQTLKIIAPEFLKNP
jgi:hypothetical protein